MPEATHNGWRAGWRRTGLVARHTLTIAFRLRLALLLGVTGAGLIAGSWELRTFNFGQLEVKFLGDFGLGVIGLFGSLLAVLATTHLFFDALGHGAAPMVLVRPVRRWEYVCGIHGGVATLLAGFVTFLSAVLAAVILTRDGAWSRPHLPVTVLLQAAGVTWLKLVLIAAMALFVCSFTSSALFASCASLMLVLAAQLRRFAPEHGAARLLRAWPDLGILDAGELLAGGRAAGAPWLAGLTLYWAAYIVLFDELSSHVFRRREC
ncbi:MAG TPA: hypothetical protein VL200_01320 [Lacunisphaera sp.]|jgi:hypothetical protein|nr:hypothetical protein [Lacunisphaera sp.]